jgi:glycerophosphoryl diester phosphodiesterase
MILDYPAFMADPHRSCAVIAHRGIWRQAPENSLAAIEQAIAEGHDVVEIDIRRTADGELVLLHDDTFSRVAGIDTAPEAMTAEEIRTIRLRDRDGGEAAALTEHRVPFLDEVFEASRDRIYLHLDVKEREVIPEVIDLALRMGVDHQVDCWASLTSQADFDWITETVLARGIPFIAKTRLIAENGAEQLELVLEIKPMICEIYFDELEDVASVRDRFHRAGIALWVNTLDAVSSAGFTDTAAVRDPEAVWGRLIDAGISAIQTDKAGLLRAFLERPKL